MMMVITLIDTTSQDDDHSTLVHVVILVAHSFTLSFPLTLASLCCDHHPDSSYPLMGLPLSSSFSLHHLCGCVVQQIVWTISDDRLDHHGLGCKFEFVHKDGLRRLIAHLAPISLLRLLLTLASLTTLPSKYHLYLISLQSFNISLTQYIAFARLYYIHIFNNKECILQPIISHPSLLNINNTIDSRQILLKTVQGDAGEKDCKALVLTQYLIK